MDTKDYFNSEEVVIEVISNKTLDGLDWRRDDILCSSENLFISHVHNIVLENIVITDNIIIDVVELT